MEGHAIKNNGYASYSIVTLVVIPLLISQLRDHLKMIGSEKHLVGVIVSDNISASVNFKTQLLQIMANLGPITWHLD